MSDDIEEDPARRQHREAPPQHEAVAQHEAAAQDLGAAQDTGAASGLRRTRLTRLAIVATLVTAAIAAVLIATGAGGSSPPRAGSRQAATTEQAVNALLAGIPQHASVLGRPTAPVILEWFGDLECPFCREFTLGALPSIIRRWVRGGQLKIEYHSMETATREPKVFKAQQTAALAAGMQNKMWNFIETFYHEQGEEDSGYVTEKYLQGIASQVPELNLSQWAEDRFDPELVTQLIADRQTVKNEHFRGTPSFLIGPTGGELRRFTHGSLTNPASFDEAIEYLLAVRGVTHI
jgi:protein-disulfide isomerase